MPVAVKSPLSSRDSGLKFYSPFSLMFTSAVAAMYINAKKTELLLNEGKSLLTS
jgi:hypothetical protein